MNAKANLAALIPNNMTRGQLAARAGIRREHLQELIANRQEPKVGTAMRLAQVLGLRVEELFELSAGRRVFHRPNSDPRFIAIIDAEKNIFLDIKTPGCRNCVFQCKVERRCLLGFSKEHWIGRSAHSVSPSGRKKESDILLAALRRFGKAAYRRSLKAEDGSDMSLDIFTESGEWGGRKIFKITAHIMPAPKPLLKSQRRVELNGTGSTKEKRADPISQRPALSARPIQSETGKSRPGF